MTVISGTGTASIQQNESLICDSCAVGYGGKIPDLYIVAYKYQHCGICDVKKAVAKPWNYGLQEFPKRKNKGQYD